jgi:hypothetical protein
VVRAAAGGWRILEDSTAVRVCEQCTRLECTATRATAPARTRPFSMQHAACKMYATYNIGKPHLHGHARRQGGCGTHEADAPYDAATADAIRMGTPRGSIISNEKPTIYLEQ